MHDVRYRTSHHAVCSCGGNNPAPRWRVSTFSCDFAFLPACALEDAQNGPGHMAQQCPVCNLNCANPPSTRASRTDFHAPKRFALALCQPGKGRFWSAWKREISARTHAPATNAPVPASFPPAPPSLPIPFLSIAPTCRRVSHLEQPQSPIHSALGPLSR
jgi:hypothetical protein